MTSNRKKFGMITTLAGAALALSSLVMAPGSASAVAATQTVALHNNTADVASDCPDTTGDYWHFVTAPNNGTFAFVSITLALTGGGSTTATMSGGTILKNGSQSDNVFVAVPSGYALSDLVLSGSSAAIAPATGSVNFVLSHLCDGDGAEETTTTVEETTTTVEETTTTVEETTTTVEETTTTLVDSEGPTTTLVDSEGPTTTLVDSEGPTTTVASGSLPQTGSSQNILLVLGVAMVLGGIVFLSLTRRPEQV